MSDAAEALGLHEPTDDYRSRPPTRWSQPWSSNLVRMLTALGALLVGFLIGSGLIAGRDVAQLQGDRRDDLIDLINARQDQAEALSAQLDDLRLQVAEVEEVRAQQAPALAEELSGVEESVGLTPLAGPGLRATFADAQSACPTGREDDCRIQDTDLQLAVNTLFGLGAEGVAINGERLISTSAVRSAGRAILVNYRVLVSPYVVEVVGDPTALHDGFARSTIGEEFAIWSEVYGLGYRLEEVANLELPAYSGSVRLRSVQEARAARGAP